MANHRASHVCVGFGDSCPLGTTEGVWTSGIGVFHGSFIASSGTGYLK